MFDIVSDSHGLFRSPPCFNLDRKGHVRDEKYVAQSTKTRYWLVIPGVGPCFLKPESYRIQEFFRAKNMNI